MNLQSPYKFIEPFTEEDRGRFFGRTEEVKRVLTLLQKTQIVLLCSKPELGKTSFLRAGISPALREMGYLPIYIPIIQDPLKGLQSAFQEAHKKGIQPPSVPIKNSDSLDLMLQKVVSSAKRPLVILFDGFERFLALPPASPSETKIEDDRERWDPYASFWKALLPCLRNFSHTVKCLFSLREEFLAEFYSLREHTPTLFIRSFRLTKLTPAQAREALQYPAEQIGLSYPPKALEQILTFLAKPDGIFPLELQIVGYDVIAQMKSQQGLITVTQDSLRSPETILNQHVEKVLRDFPADQFALALEIFKELIQGQKRQQSIPLEYLVRQLEEPVEDIRDMLAILQATHLVQCFSQNGLETYELMRPYLADILIPFLRRQEEFVRSKREELYRFCRRHSADPALKTYPLTQILSGRKPPLKLLPTERELLTVRAKLREQKRYLEQRKLIKAPLRKVLRSSLLIAVLIYLVFVVLGIHAFYFEVSPIDHQTIRIMRGRPMWKFGLVEIESTGYTLEDIERKEDAAILLKKEPISDIERWKEQLIPKLTPLQKGIAYREIEKNSEAIQVLQPLLESPKFHIARRAAVELVQMTSDKALLLQAREVLTQQGGGNTFVLLSSIQQSDAPVYLKEFIKDVQEKLKKDGMVLVPRGEFLMGSSVGNDDEKPLHTVYLGDFYIDKYEITNAQYKEFVDSMGPKFSPWHWRDGRYEPGRENHPVVNVTWYNAKSYCEWSGKRLPTEAEWEKASRGSEGWLYPWGNQFDQSLANVKDSGKLTTAPVGSYERGKSPYGVYDMAGNVWEWTSSLNMSYPYRSEDGREDLLSKGLRVIRGGAFNYYHDSARATNRRYFESQSWDFSIGFRCARSAS